MTVDYHSRELEIARDPSHPLRALPPISGKYGRILDVGCGIGQTLIASNIPESAVAIGVDVDEAALRQGASKLLPSNVCLLAGSGEHLPFKSEEFDFVFSRVSVPYMRINQALAEFSRVLAPGGDLWLILHPARMVLGYMKKSALKGDIANVAYLSYVLANGVSFNLTGRQYSLLGRQETFQTSGGIRRALTRAGFQSINVSRGRHFIVTASKA